ncbi:endo alpha-1,4 polygalactosaminidase [Amnibacterium kyonggiense]|uniref:Glycosyl hydrolase family 114 n=1 Tax=Amnibacterium kyonggiense TaxID=595671 RepID=A0A4R7FGP0_9MICO|nr:endo alpha-1,4 polygalactosaminidase [Amnibacterium kyonggiense]TDS75807.1 glycosyl hydrolase family 114 [Amnibacterium kyonggiense]
MTPRSAQARLRAAAVAALLVCSGLGVSGCTSGAAPAVPDAAPSIMTPPVQGRFDYQLGGAYPPASTVRIVDRDRTASPAAGTYTICYVNGFQTQESEADLWTERHPDLLVEDSAGEFVKDPDWPEYVLDISTPAKRSALLRIVGPWIDGCAAAGFRGLEIDNLDSYTRSAGRLTLHDAVEFATALVARAHARGLAVGQKNTAELAATGRKRIGFDFAVTEECQRYAECSAYTRVYGDHVIEIEYTDYSRSVFRAACAARGGRISVILRDRDVVTPASRAYRSETC